MQYRRLGRTDLNVSAFCLGTMTFGEQNSEADAHAQLDLAVERGINFIDVAEMYPVPPRSETYGLSERFVGNWLAARKNRDKIVLATKAIGRGDQHGWIRGGLSRLDRKNIHAAVEASLTRLRTGYIDLYQLHWPDRRTNTFGRLGYSHDGDDRPVPLEETLEALDALVRAGKIRHVGVSNETPWGLMKMLAIGEAKGLPRPVTIQNAYNLLNRTFEIGLAEAALRETVGLMAYSPLAMGTLSGKYLGGARPAGSRMALFGQRYLRYFTPNAEPAVAAYTALARRHGHDPVQMALAYVLSRPFVACAIVGATSTVQLAGNLASGDFALGEEVLAGIEEIHRQNANPCP